MSDFTGLEISMGWQGPILPLGKRAGNLDQRSFDNPSWHLPMSISDNHDSPELIGPVDRAEVLSIDQLAERMPLSDQDRAEIGERVVWMSGRFAPTEDGMKAAAQLAFWGRLPVSMEGRDGTVVYEPVYDEQGNEIGERQVWTSITLAGLAIERKKAFAGAFIIPDASAAAFVPSEDDEDVEFDDDDDEMAAELKALTDEALRPVRQAAAGPVPYPAGFFAKLDYSEPTRLTISAQGEVTGHVAVWGRRYRQQGGGNWVAARSGDLSEWLVGDALLDDGRVVKTGVIVSDAMHQWGSNAIRSAAAMREAVEDTSAQVMQVYAWEDPYGIAVHGSTLPGVTQAQATRAMAGCPSIVTMDQRDGRGHLPVAVLCVSMCGLKPGDAVVTTKGGHAVTQVLAASAVLPEDCGCGGTCGGCGDGPGLVEMVDQLATRARFVGITQDPTPTGGDGTTITIGQQNADVVSEAVRAASADETPPKPVVDLGALAEIDRQWERQEVGRRSGTEAQGVTLAP